METTSYKVSLAAARVNAGFSQKEAAAKLGVSNKTLCQWELGTSMPRADKIDAICALYHVPYDCITFLRQK